MALNVQQINPSQDGSMAEVQVAHSEGFEVENGTLVVLGRGRWPPSRGGRGERLPRVISGTDGAP
jgi:hypothetical protein